MTERAASSTAVLVCQGRAAADGRYAVGRFSDPIARQLLDPPECVVLETVRAGQVPKDGAGRMAYELVRRTGISMVPRTIAIDEAVRGRPTPQVVILGAGLDGRAWRMPELAGATVFEVDHPASQRDKVRRVGDFPAKAKRVGYVAVDLAAERLGAALEAAGFDAAAETTWVWEGVVPYLTADEVRATVAQVAALSAPGSQLVVNYQARSLSTTVMRRVMRLVLRLSRQPDPLAGEPWRSKWAPEGMRAMLGDHGFEVTSDRDLLTLSTGLDLPPDNDASLRNGRVALAVRR
jgi:methyltransferase (TIGR00027 family)